MSRYKDTRAYGGNLQNASLYLTVLSIVPGELGLKKQKEDYPRDVYIYFKLKKVAGEVGSKRERKRTVILSLHAMV